MSEAITDKIRSRLENANIPLLGTDLVSTQCLKAVTEDGGKITVGITLGFPAQGYRQELQNLVRSAIAEVIGDAELEVTVDWDVVAHKVQQGTQTLANVKNIIAVASGKGGVGKSTTAVNLALALQAEGGRVGLLDADIYGPSQPRMLGVSKQRPESTDGKSMEPVVGHGIQSMSIGYLLPDEETPMIWRGPMVTQTLEQLLRETRWNDLDYLVIDLPPGTGDTQLTLSQRIPVSGAVIVTTPQDISLIDARKGLKMFEKVNVPVLGIIENMSIHICSQCGHQEPIFGSGGGSRMAEDYSVELLGQLPLDAKVRENVDNGHPSVVEDPESSVSQIYRSMARRVSAKLSLQAKDYSAKFPKIVIENN